MKTILHIIYLSLLFVTLSFADIINVPSDIDSIQGGIDLANDGDTVLVAPGIYVENIHIDSKKITISSHFINTNDKSLIKQTVIDGNYVTSVVRFDSVDSNTVLTGFTIKRGNGGVVCGGSCHYWGGGINCFYSNPILSNLIITENQSVAGGGIYLSHSSPKLINVTIFNNRADTGGGINFGMGGGCYFCNSGETSKPVFDNNNRCNIYLNYAEYGSDLAGGDSLINVVVDTFTVLNPTDFHVTGLNNFIFDIMYAKIKQEKNNLYVNPKGNNINSGLKPEEPLKTIYYALMKIIADSLNPRTIHLANGEYKNEIIIDLALPNYINIKGESRSGVIFRYEDYIQSIFQIHNVNVSLENFTIIGDEPHPRSGINCSNSNLTLKNLMLIGGRIQLWDSNAHLERVIITGNTHQSALGDVHSSHVNLLNCTISDNETYRENSGGVYLDGSTSINIINSIFWNNLPYEINYFGSESGSGVSITVINSLIKDGKSRINHIYGNGDIYWLNGILDIDPRFIDPANLDYRLQKRSPAIDKGIQDTMIVYNGGKDTLYIPPMDYVGNAPDIGASEYGDPLVIEEESNDEPSKFTLRQNYPNPFNPITMINYQLPMNNKVELSIYNLLGQKVATLVNEKQNAGYHQIEWDASGFASGIYYYQIKAGEFQDVKKMILLK